MLRPATPLSILYGIAFLLLLLSTISTPIVKSIPLASYEGSKFGVFGYCSPTSCTGPALGYVTENESSNSTPTFTLPTNTRHSLSSILIVHPIAAFLTLICFIMALAAHFHAPSHSPNYLLTLLVLGFPTLLVSLLAFLVDILLFIPHLGWGGWIVLGATIIIMACTIVTCAMRRTIVSRKARERRIGENKDMNGENFYSHQFMQRQERQQQDMQRMAKEQQEQQQQQQLARADSPPPLSSITAVNQDNTGNAAGFATYEYGQATPSTRDEMARMDQQSRPGEYGGGGRTYGNGDYVQTNADGSMRRDQSGSRSRPGDSQQVGGRPPPFYGRGRGAYPPRGGPRGMYLPGPNGYSARGYRGPRGPPPPGWNGNRRMMAGPEAAMAAGAMMGRGGRGPPPGYDRRYYGPPDPNPYGQGPAQYDEMNPYVEPAAAMPASVPVYEQYGDPSEDPTLYGYSGRAISPGRVPESGTPRGRSPPPPVPTMREDNPIGMAVEMDGRHGSLARGPETIDPAMANEYSSSHGQTHELAPASRNVDDPHNNAELYHPMSPYANDDPAELGDRSPILQHSSPTKPPSTTTPINNTLPHARTTSAATATRSRASSDHYYEDVDPRFAESQSQMQQPPIPSHSPQPLPAVLMPGYTAILHTDPSTGQPPHTTTAVHPDQDPDADHEPISSPPSRTRSPQESDTSEYTSISQRGINPAWRPGPGDPGYGMIRTSRFHGTQAQAQSQSQGHSWRAPPATAGVLDENPDFSLPGVGPSRRRGESAGSGSVAAAASAQGAGPYPGAI